MNKKAMVFERGKHTCCPACVRNVVGSGFSKRTREICNLKQFRLLQKCASVHASFGLAFYLFIYLFTQQSTDGQREMMVGFFCFFCFFPQLCLKPKKKKKAFEMNLWSS